MCCVVCIRLCRFLNRLSHLLCSWLDVIDNVCDSLCSHCYPEDRYVPIPDCPQKGDVLNEQKR